MRSNRGVVLAAVLSVLLGATVGACSKPISFVVLRMSSTGTAEIRGVTQIVVNVSQPPSFDKTLTYPAKSGTTLTINETNVTDLSVSFTGARSGTVSLVVEARGDTGCVLAKSRPYSAAIHQGATSAIAIAMEKQREDCSTPDGGTEGDGGVILPGCDPVRPACAAGQTCQVNCTTSMNECTAGGTGRPGTPCETNKDCAPGSQCFDYKDTGCNVKVCLRFCDTDALCSPGGADGGADGGAASSPTGTSSVCQGLVPCKGFLTAYHTCTFGCDPRQAAVAAGSTGCPAGLSCIVVGSMDQVDCACPEASRQGTDGADCAGGADCAPGYICNLMAAAKKCRAVCRCDAKNSVCTAANACAGNKVCSPLTNETTFGACL